MSRRRSSSAQLFETMHIKGPATPRTDFSLPAGCACPPWEDCACRPVDMADVVWPTVTVPHDVLLVDYGEDGVGLACPECERSYGPHYRGECEHG